MKAWRPSNVLKLFEDPVFIAPPVLCHGRVWVGAKRRQIVSLDPRTWTKEQAIPAEGFELHRCVGDVLLGESADRQCRAFGASGNILWTQPSDWGWVSHPSAAIALGPSVSVIDVATGLAERKFEIGEAKVKAAAVAGSTLLI